MKSNMGPADKIVRAIAAAVVAILFFTHVISGTTAIISGGLALILLATSLVGFCPLYLPFGISTRRKNKSRSN